MSNCRKSLVVPTKALFYLIVILMLSTQSWAQTLRPTLILQPDDIAEGDAFGGSVEAAGSLLLISAPGDQSSGFPGGALYVFERDRIAFQWHQVLEILPEQSGQEIGPFTTDGQTFAYFLHSPGTFTTPEIHIWERGAKHPWEHRTTLDSDQIIFDLKVNGDDLVAVGSNSVLSHQLLQSFRVGGVWLPLTSAASFSPGQDGFDLRGDVLMVGSKFTRRASTGSLFPMPTGIRPPAQASIEEGGFGSAAAISDDGRWLAMGSSVDDLDGELSGSVYLFEIFASGDPVQAGRLAPSDAGPHRRFGAAVQFDGNRLAASAPGDPDQGIPSKTYVFDIQTDGEVVETHQLDLGEPRLAMVDDAVFVGAPSPDIFPSTGGSVLAYSLEDIATPPRVSLDPIAQCPADAHLTVTGHVEGSEEIAQVTGTLDGGSPETLCSNCGLQPSFQYPVDLLACRDNGIVVTATDADGQSDSASISIYFDDEDPVIVGCEDQTIQIPEGEISADAEQPTASDECEVVSFTCSHSSEYEWPRFPVGADQPASCTAIDRCGRQATCTFTVTVEEEADTGEVSHDFEDLQDGPIPEDLEIETTGGGSGLAEILDGKLQVVQMAPTPRPSPSSTKVTATVITHTQVLRVETSLPEPEEGSTEGKGGVTVTVDGGEEPAMVRISRNILNGMLEVEARQEEGEETVMVAAPISDAGVTDIALEVVDGVAVMEVSLDQGLTWIQPSDAKTTINTLDRPLQAGFFVELPATGSEALIDDRVERQLSQKSLGVVAFSFGYLKISQPETPPCRDDDFHDETLDPAWRLTGVGNANVHSAVEVDGELQLTANGATAFYAADNAGFLYRQITGDFRMETTIDGNPMTTGGKFRKAGLMVRQSLDHWDIRLLAFLVPYWFDGDETHLQFAARRFYGAPGYHPVAHDVVGVPRVVRLAVIREGQTLSVEYSIDDGLTWIRPTTGLGGSITIDDLAPSLLVGLGMVSNNVSETSTAHFDDFSLCRP